MAFKRIAESTIRRLSLYLGYLQELNGGATPDPQGHPHGQLAEHPHGNPHGNPYGNAATVSSSDLARLVGTTSAQVRKDLSFFGSFGKRGLGYSVPELTASIRQILGLERDWRVCIVGAGRIGGALAQYPGFGPKRFHVAAVYDADPAKIGTYWDGNVVRDVKQLPADAATEAFDIGVIAVPAEAAQSVADLLVSAGIKGLMNFAPTQILAPADVIVKTVNMALEFEGLSFALAHRADIPSSAAKRANAPGTAALGSAGEPSAAK